MRYTESRLTAVAMALLDGHRRGRGRLPRRPTTAATSEPVVLPAAFPNLLANGASGHRGRHGDQHPAAQCRRAAAARWPGWPAARPTAPRRRSRSCCAHVQGPDLPDRRLPGRAARPASPRPIATGRGSFRLRARWEKEELAYGQYQVVVTEIPYQVQKGRLIERMAELLAQKKLPLLADLRDESTETVRLVLVPKSRIVDARAADGAAVPRRPSSRCGCRST